MTKYDKLVADAQGQRITTIEGVALAKDSHYAKDREVRDQALALSQVSATMSVSLELAAIRLLLERLVK